MQHECHDGRDDTSDRVPFHLTYPFGHDRDSGTEEKLKVPGLDAQSGRGDPHSPVVAGGSAPSHLADVSLKGVISRSRVVSSSVWAMLCRFVYLLVRRFLDVLRGRFRSRVAKDVEIAVLRHQLEVLRRQASRLDLEPADRAVLAVLSGLLPRVRWSAFAVTPATILRWHRDLVHRRWTP